MDYEITGTRHWRRMLEIEREVRLIVRPRWRRVLHAPRLFYGHFRWFRGAPLKARLWVSWDLTWFFIKGPSKQGQVKH